MHKILNTALVAAGFLAGATNMAHAQTAAPVAIHVARTDAHASHAMMLSATHAGKRIVAVGANGYIILSDDNGARYRQAQKGPVDFTLTGVSFVDDKNGWAVGHGGTILHTSDGGETWAVQRTDTNVDQPLFTVHFSDAQNGWAAGLWSLLLHTADGGKTWEQLKLPVAEGQKRNDLNLLRIFPGHGDELYIAAEQGTLFRSKDKGQHWEIVKTGSKASLWSGIVTIDNTLLAGGLGGKLLRSTDGGAHWDTLASPVTGSITGMAVRDKTVTAVSLDGSVLQSSDDGATWHVTAAAPVPLIALVLDEAGKPLAYSKEGPVAVSDKQAK